MINVSGFGLVAQVTATTTFPTGFPVTAFSDDSDPMESPDLQIADTGMGLNGDLVVWQKAEGVEVVVNVIPTSDDDVNLDALLEANRVSKGKTSTQETIGIVFNYPSGMTVTCSKGTIISGSLVPVVTQAGRIKTRQYRFRFESVTKAGQ